MSVWPYAGFGEERLREQTISTCQKRVGAFLRLPSAQSEAFPIAFRLLVSHIHPPFWEQPRFTTEEYGEHEKIDRTKTNENSGTNRPVLGGIFRVPMEKKKKLV